MMDYNATQDEHEHQQRHRMQVMMNRFKPGGDKWESIRADEQAEKVEEDRIQAEEERLRIMGIVECKCAKSNWDSLSCPLHGIVDISEKEN